MRRCLVLAMLAAVVAAALPASAQFGASALSPEGVITAAERQQELATKMDRLTSWLKAEGYHAVLFNQYRSFQWITAGADMTVVAAAESGPVTLAISAAGEKYAVCANDEAVRMEGEELGELGYEILDFEWYQDKPGFTGKQEVLDKLLGGKGKIAADFDTPMAENRTADLAELRAELTPPEIKKMRWLGRECAEACEIVCRTMKRGATEKEVQAMISDELYRREIQPTVLLMAGDDRLYHYRHAIATDAPINEYGQVNICAKKWGLVIAVTRYVYFGEPPRDLVRKLRACARVCGAYLSQTKPGARAGDILVAGQEMMAQCGYPDEWRLHHQGGAIGYAERDWVTYPGAPMVVHPNQTFAWNPTIAGAKVEDTILINADGSFENLTDTGNWPTISVAAGSQQYKAPSILVR